MNILDTVLAGILAFNLTIGFLKGFLQKAFGVLSFAIGVVAAYAYYKNGGTLFKVMLVFILANLVLRVLFWVLKKMLRGNIEGPSFFSRVGGGIIGGAEGALCVLAVLVLLHFLNGMAGAAHPGIPRVLENSLFYSRYKEFSKSSNIPGVKETFAMGESLKGKQKKLVLDPAAAGKLRDNPSIKAILEDKQLLESIQKKDFAKIISNPKFIKLLSDKELLKQLGTPGLYQIQNTLQGDQEADPGSK